MNNKNLALKGGQRAWIFQANPDKYEINTSLRLEFEESWNLRQQARYVKEGDRVLIWICGKAAGVYALGTVVTDPQSRPDTTKGIEYWNDKLDGLTAKPRVVVRYDEVFLDKPLLRDFLRCDPALWNLKILINPRRLLKKWACARLD